MPSRFGPGPVFVYESLAAARRPQLYASRSLFVLALLAGISMMWGVLTVRVSGRPAVSSIRQMAQVGEYFFYAIASVEITVVLLAAPAATAGAICLDRARGTLTHALVTDLSDAEVVLGKLAARLAPVLALVGAAVPVLALAGLLGGIDFGSLAVLTVVTLAVAVFGCALALAVSVRAARAHDVLTVVYAVWGMWVLVPLFWELLPVRALPAWLTKLNPYVLALAPYAWPGYVGIVDLCAFLGLTLGASVVLVGYTVLRLRSEFGGHAPGRSGRAPSRLARAAAAVRRFRPGPTLDANPVLWREWHRDRPSRLSRIVWGLFAALSVAGFAWGVVLLATEKTEAGRNLLIGVNAFHVTLGLLLVSLAAPSALSEERARGSLDVLMATPLRTSSIVLGKWRGAFRAVPALAVLPAIGMMLVVLTLPEPEPSIGWTTTPAKTVILHFSLPNVASPTEQALAAVLPPVWVVVQGAAVTSLGLLLATWFPRPGRAVGLSVSLYVVATFGMIVLLEGGVIDLLLHWTGIAPMVSGKRQVSEAFRSGLISLSPIGGQIVPPVNLANWTRASRVHEWIAQGVGLAFLAGLSALLLGLTLATFDRRLGRTSGRAVPTTRPPRRVGSRRGRPVAVSR